MPRRLMGKLLIAGGLLLALLAAGATRAAISAAQREVQVVPIRVLEASSRLEPGSLVMELLQEDKLTVRQHNAASVPPSAIILNHEDPAEANRYLESALAKAELTTALEQGDVLKTEHLQWPRTKELQLEAQMRALAIAVDAVAAVGGFIREGSRVDVIAAYRREGDEESQARSAILVLQDVEVLALIQETEDSAPQPRIRPLNESSATTAVAVLGVNPNDALLLSYMAAYADELRLVLRPQGVGQVRSPAPVTERSFER